MDHVQTVTCLNGLLFLQFLVVLIWISNFQYTFALKMPPVSQLASPPSIGLFEPIEISPAVIPRYPFPGDLLPPMYPSFPTTYNPILTGRCPFNFSSISSFLDKTACDCSQPLAAVVGNVICCPQFSSLLRMFQGYFNTDAEILVLQGAVADYCFTDLVNILASRGANSSIPAICSVKSSNITGGSCPVKDRSTFDKVVNTTKLLEACSIVDPLKECCRPVCHSAIAEAALQMSSSPPTVSSNASTVGDATQIDALSDCKGVVYSWLARKLTLEAANSAFRILSACKVNKVCPLDFKQPSEVIEACRDIAATSPSCCSSLNTYIAGIQKQMLITNRQAIICATVFGSMLRKSGVMTDVFELCDVDLKDFSLQAYGQEGCLLRSLPADVVYDNATGLSFTCDLSDNIAAPWPVSSSMSTLPLCAPEMSLPALPTSQTLENTGCLRIRLDALVTIFWFFLLVMLLY